MKGYSQLLLAVIVLVCGCSVHSPVPALIHATRHLNDIVPEKTTREDILFRFGCPSGVFNDSSILTYRLTLSENGLENTGIEYYGKGNHDKNSMTKRWIVAKYNLIVVFNDQGTVNKWQLLKLK